jgi:FkbM family methyltransferase
LTKQYTGPLAGIRAWNSRRRERRRQRRALAVTLGAIERQLVTLAPQVQSLVEATERLGLQVKSIVADDEVKLGALARLLELLQAERDSRAAGQAETSRQLVELARNMGAADRHVAELAALESCLAGLGSLEKPPPRLQHEQTPARADTWPVIVTARPGLVEPELELIAHLAPALEPRVAIDVGAHHGRFSEVLLDLGFEVHALEPNPAALDVLLARLGDRPGMTVHRAAAGAEDGEAELGLVANPAGDYIDPTQFASISGLPLPEGLVRAGSVRVPLRRLDSLVREQGMVEPTLVKVDAEGFDLEVLRGLGALRPAVQLAEFWDDALPFSAPGAKNRLRDLVAHARQQGAAWHLVVFRRWGDDRPAFYSGLSDSPERAWGNVIFFMDRALFERARAFLSGLLPEARFTAPR